MRSLTSIGRRAWTFFLNRVRTPLIRQPDGDFEPATWDQAFALINERLAPLLAEDRNSVAVYLGNPNAHLLGNILYGRVLAATASKSASELALVFDHGDCSGHPKQELSLRIIGVAGGDAPYQGVHNAMPSEVSGRGRAISDAAASMGVALDDNMKPGVAPNTVHPGIVAGIPHLTLIPEGGPRCSAMLTSEEHSVHLGTGTEFILTMQSMPE